MPAREDTTEELVEVGEEGSGGCVEDLGEVLMKELWMMVVVDEDKGKGKLTELCRSC